MTEAPTSPDWPAPPVTPPRRHTFSAASPVDQYLLALEESLAGQMDTALEAGGIIAPLGAVARATLVEAIGADREAAVRDLMLTGVPREQAEGQAVANLGPAPALGHSLLVARRRQAVEAWQRGRDSFWWWMEPLIPVGVAVAAVFLAAIAPTMAVITGMAAQPQLGTFAVALVPLVVGLFAWVAGALPPTFGGESKGQS
jgi:hypothetical protein